MTETKDRLVSTGVLHGRLTELEEEIRAQRKMRPESDPFFTHANWLLEEFRAAIKLAALEYRPTAEVAVLTGWDPQTLRAKARAILAGEYPGEGWRELLVKHEAGEYSFAVATVPVKRTGELQRA